MILRLFVLLVCYIPIVEIFLPKTNFGAGIPDIGPVRFISYLLVMAFLLNIAATKRNIPLNKWSVNLLFFSILVLLSVGWSKESFNVSTIAAIFDSVFIPFFISLIAFDIFSEKENVDRFIKNLCMAVFLLSLVSVYMLIFSVQTNVTEGDVIRSAGFGKLGNSNALAIFLVLAIPCILYSIKQNIFQRKIIGWTILFAVYGGIICTVSRKGLITMFLATTIYLFLTKQFSKVVGCFVFCLCAVILVYGYGVQNSASRFEKDEIEHELSSRADMASAGVKMFISSPIIGKGYKGYYNNWKRYFPFSGREGYSAHNIFVTALANYGILGFVPFMMIFLYPLFVSFWILRTGIKSDEGGHLNEVAIICISTVPCFMLNGYFAGGLFYNPVIMALLYSIISFTISAYKETKKSTSFDIVAGKIKSNTKVSVLKG